LRIRDKGDIDDKSKKEGKENKRHKTGWHM